MADCVRAAYPPDGTPNVKHYDSAPTARNALSSSRRRPPPPWRAWLRRRGLALLWTVLALPAAWAVLAIVFSSRSTWLGAIAAAGFASACIALAWFARPRRYALGGYAGLLVIVAGWYVSISP